MSKLYCDKGCQKQFSLSDMKAGTEILDDNIERHYIECPNCGEQYTSYYMDDKMKEVQVHIKMLQKKAPLKIKQKNQLNKLIRKMQFMNNQLRLKVEGK